MCIRDSIWLFEYKSGCLGLQLDYKTLPISSLFDKVVPKVVLRLSYAGNKNYIINNSNYLDVIWVAQKMTSNFLELCLITVTYFWFEIEKRSRKRSWFICRIRVEICGLVQNRTFVEPVTEVGFADKATKGNLHLKDRFGGHSRWPNTPNWGLLWRNFGKYQKQTRSQAKLSLS